jgi:hypothetical protein
MFRGVAGKPKIKKSEDMKISYEECIKVFGLTPLFL